MDFWQSLEDASKLEHQNLWKGTFRDFLHLYEEQKDVQKNMGGLAHQRIYNMIIDNGVEERDYFGTKRKTYKFFENVLFGTEDSIDAIMSYIHSAAQRTETSRRMLLLYGPPSSGKSEIVSLIKRGLERYSRTPEGAIYAVAGSKMHENPFLLVPDHMRSDFEDNYKISIDGHLSPITQHKLKHDFNGNFMEFPIEQILFSEANRVGIGTWLPSDTKSQDLSELVGGIDFAKIKDIGDESDPRAYNFDGELLISNRGVCEFIEGLKADEKFLRSNLTATQEKAVKAPRFGLISVDNFIVMHTNETEFRNFMAEAKYEAYHDRMVMVPQKHNLGVSNEVKIYQKLLQHSDAIKKMHIAPHTLEAASMFAILTRLEADSDESLSLINKMKLYDSKHVKGYKIEQVPDIKKKSTREGMFGVSPRFIIDQISASLSNARVGGCDFVTALDILRQLDKAVTTRDTFKPDEKNRYKEYIDLAKNEWHDMLRNDIQKAFFVEYEEDAKNLFENYLDHIEAFCADKKPRDPITGDEIEVDEKLMESIEGHIGVSHSGSKDFRNEILRYVAISSRKDKHFDYTQHSQLKEAIRKQLFEERQGVIRMTVSVRNPDPEQLRRYNDVIKRMADKQGYSVASANELCKYASSHLFDK